MSDVLLNSPKFDESVMDVWNYENSVEQYHVTGGTSRQSVQEQINCCLQALI